MTTENSLTKKQNEDEEYEYVAIPPDGGFGWVVALSAMLCNLVCDGILFSFGTMKMYLQQSFRCSDTVILLVGSLPCGIYLLVGPIVSGLANRYGCRPIIILGSFGATVSMALSTLSPNPWVMMVIYGLFGGVFFGMVYLPSVVMVSFYFDKKRAIANGLVTAGTGVGALSFPPLASYIMGMFGWKVGMLIFAGTMLSCAVFGAIMKPLKPTRVPIKRNSYYAAISDKTNSPITKMNSQLVSVDDDVFTTNNIAFETHTDNYESSGSTAPPPYSRLRTLSTSSQTSSDYGNNYRHGVLDPDNASRPLYKKDTLFTGSKQQLHTSHTSLHTNPYIASVSNIPKAISETEKQQSAFRAFFDILSGMTNFSILNNTQMLLICIGNVFSMLGYYLPIMCLVSFATEDLHINKEKASFLMTIFGMCNTIGRFAGGPISMIPHLNALRVHNGLLYFAGILTVAAAYSYNYITCALYAGLCGFALAPHMSLLPSVICDCVGLDRYTTAFGILFLFRGVTSIIGPPAAGFIKDVTKGYDIAFAIGGAMIIIGAFFHICLACVKPERSEEKETEDVYV